MNDEYDAIIVGARVAGSIVAARLGDAGYRVLLVDRAAFPSTTLSTHFFRGAGMVSVLDQLGVLDQVLALGCPQLARQYVYQQGDKDFQIGPPQNPGALGFCLSVRREPFDHILLQRAVQTGNVHLMERTRVTQLHWDGERVNGVTMTTRDGETHATAKIVIGADGRHSFVARAVKAPVEVDAPPSRALYYTYIKDFPSPTGGAVDGPEFSMLDDEIAYSFPSDQGYTCLAVSVNLGTFRWLRSAATARFWERIAHHRGFSERLAAIDKSGGKTEKVLGTGPEPNYVRTPVGPGWALVGDAGLHQDPWSGQGMDLAGNQAMELADALIDWFSGNSPETDALQRYHARRNESCLEIYERTVRLARDLRQLG